MDKAGLVERSQREGLLYILFYDDQCPLSVQSLSSFEVLQQTDAVFSKCSHAINARYSSDLASQFGIYALPSVVLLQNGKPVLFKDGCDLPKPLYAGPLDDSILKQITSQMSYILSHLNEHHFVVVD
ncbi:hypothetical protein GEMRC1_012848 [Eukaryota sp. GEM-RC1]